MTNIALQTNFFHPEKDFWLNHKVSLNFLHAFKNTLVNNPKVNGILRFAFG